MATQQLDRDTIERPTINPWRQKPSAAQERYAADLCKSELPYAERVKTIASFPAMDAAAMSELIDHLSDVREKRMARLRRVLHGKRR